MMSEETIIEYCSPTLAGLKTGNMFSLGLKETRDIISELRELNNMIVEKGLRVIPLKKTAEHVLIYVYRPDRLRRDLSDPLAREILKNKGYDLTSPKGCIVQLVKHLKNDKEFPHEVGLFLGYPASDVACFMKSSRNGVKCSGHWKAYSDPEKAQKTFYRFKRCTEIYRAMNKKGRSLMQLTVITDREQIMGNRTVSVG
jgi:hypothetical protein